MPRGLLQTSTLGRRPFLFGHVILEGPGNIARMVDGETLAQLLFTFTQRHKQNHQKKKKSPSGLELR